MKPFVVCIHDVTPAHARETEAMIDDLAPLLGRRFSFGVVPDWHGQWALRSHPGYCALVKDSSGELLLHGYSHQRSTGWGPIATLTGRCDEMNGLDPAETRITLERGQAAFADAFGSAARGFLAPGWQRGHVRPHAGSAGSAGPLDYVLGFFSIESRTGARVPLATWTWDCGRWGWLGHVGNALGGALHFAHGGVPCLAIHPGDLARGFWPTILRLVDDLLERGYEPVTVASLVDAAC